MVIPDQIFERFKPQPFGRLLRDAGNGRGVLDDFEGMGEAQFFGVLIPRGVVHG